MKPSANPKRTLIESLQVGLAWDSQIKEWAERELPNGEVVGRVKNAQTVNYKTLKPVKDGLFCEKIFGPTKDFECACGFKQTRGGFCPQCNVEFTRSEVRRYRLGYFQLPSAVTHVWYLRGRPSYISYLLGIKIKKALALTYGAASLLVNSQNEKVISQEESESFPFSFTTQTLYTIGECKGKTVPRSQIRRYNPNYFLFDKKRTKLMKNLFHSFLYTSHAKMQPSVFVTPERVGSPFSHLAEQAEKKEKQSFHLLEKSTLPLSQVTQKTGLQGFYKEKKDSISLSSQIENSKTSLLSTKPHDLLTSSYITKPFIFSSTIRGGWQPLIVVNLQDKLPVNLSYKKKHSKHYKFKKYLKFSQNMGFYIPSIFAKQKQGVENVLGKFLQSQNLKQNEIFEKPFFAQQNQAKDSSLVKTHRPDETFGIPNVNGLINIRLREKVRSELRTDGDKSTIAANNGVEYFSQKNMDVITTGSKLEINCPLGDKKTTKFLSSKSVLSKKKKKIKKILVGIDKNKESSLSTLIFYPIKKEISKIQEKESLIKNYPELTKKFYQELDFKFKDLNYVEKTTKQIGLSSFSDKKLNAQDNFKEAKFGPKGRIFEHTSDRLRTSSMVAPLQSSEVLSDVGSMADDTRGSGNCVEDAMELTANSAGNVKPSDKNQSFTLNRKELTDFRSLFHFIGQPCQLKKKSRFLIHTAFSFSQTRNQIFKILEKEKSINSVDFGHKLSCYDENLKDKYRILNSNVKKQYHQNHLFPYLFCLSCQSKNYQYLQTYSNFFIPTLFNSEKTLFVSSYKNQTRKNQFLNLYDSSLKNNFTISNLFSCFDNSSIVGLNHLTHTLAMHSSADYFAKKNAIENSESLIGENQFQKESHNKFSEKNVGEAIMDEATENNSRGETFGKENEFRSKDALQLQNSNFLKDQSIETISPTHGGNTVAANADTAGNDQVDTILGEIPLVLDLCENIFGDGEKNSQFFQQKKKILQNKLFAFWKLKKKTKLLQYKNLQTAPSFALLGKNITFAGSGFNQNKLKALQFSPETVNKMLSFGETRKKRRKGAAKMVSKNAFLQGTTQNSKLLASREGTKYEKLVPEILLKLSQNSPSFLQNISINSFFNSSKSDNFFRGLLTKKLFFIEGKSKFFEKDTLSKQKRRETHQPILSLYEPVTRQAKTEFSKFLQNENPVTSDRTSRSETSYFVTKKTPFSLCENDEKYRKFQKIDFFESFVEQNFPPEWKSKQQIKKILKTANILKNFQKLTLSPIPSTEWSYLSKKLSKEDYLFSIYEISVQQALDYTCGEAILKVLSPIDCYQLESGLKVVLWQINERISEVEDQGFLLKSDIILLNSLRTKKSRTLRRLKIAKILRKTKVLPKQMVFSLLPVLPPSLRPIIQLDENIVAVSDCSQIYQKIVQRSNRLSKRMSKYLSYDHCLRLKVLLQQAVDGLIENGKGGSKPLCDNNGRPLKSLSDGLKGKKGRFRQDLLGRRVDYSGRSVIVVGPALKLHQCGLPKEMAIELFQPFLIRQLFAKKIVSNIAVAKNYIKKETPIVLEILKQLLRSHPVLLNRAPTLHRLGVQAFQPKLVSGRAILLHPLVCSAFNADFDGDQMAVHIPLSSKARGEAWKILWSRNNILSPATGQPILVPSQDMVLGCYYLTTKKANFLTKNYFGAKKNNINKQNFTFSNRPFFNQPSIYDHVNGGEAMVAEPQSSEGSMHPSDDRVSDALPQAMLPKEDCVENTIITGGDENLQNQSDVFNFKKDFGKKVSQSENLESDTETLVFPRENLESHIKRNVSEEKLWQSRNKWTGFFFNNSHQVLKDLQQKRLKLHSSIWLKMDCDVEIHKEEQKPLEARINCYGNFTKIYPGYLRRFYKKQGLFFNDNKIKKLEDFYVRTTCGRVMLNQTISPISHQPF